MKAKPSISLSDQTKPEKWASKVARLKGSNSLLFADTTTPLLRAFCGIEMRPLVVIHPYRMEGKVRLDATKGMNLFAFWKTYLTNMLIEAVKANDERLTMMEN